MDLSFLKSRHVKVYVIIILMFIFSIFYMFLNDENFSGINIVSETIKNELIKKEVVKDINKNKYVESYSDIGIRNTDKNNIDKKVKDIEKKVKKEYNTENVEKSILQRYFDRFYFSVITGCLLGYGDIYPISNISKLLVMIQSLMTIITIVY